MPEALARTVSAIHEGIAQRLHMGAQLYVALRGQVIADRGIGHAHPGESMTPQHINLWLSSTKPIAAICIARLWEERKLGLDDPVARFIPEFAQRGKESVTIRHVLTHTGGFRGVASNWTSRPWNEVIDRICRAGLEPGWTPGHKAGYHVASGWFILGEVIRRITGQPFEQHVREAVFLPLGMIDSWIGMPIEQFKAYGPRIAPMYVTENGDFSDDFVGNTQKGVTLCRPGGNGRGPIRDLGRFYEALLQIMKTGRVHEGGSFLSSQSVEAMIARHRVGLFDHTFKHVLDWGLGFIPNNHYHGPETVPYGYGPHASMRTFGHSGHQSSAAFADPEHDLIVAIVFNGMPGERSHDARIRSVLPAIYQDLGLAGPTMQ